MPRSTEDIKFEIAAKDGKRNEMLATRNKLDKEARILEKDIKHLKDELLEVLTTAHEAKPKAK